MTPRLIAALTLFSLLAVSAMSASALEIKMAMVRVDYPELRPISRLEEKAQDIGFAGAELALQDIATTGQFMGHSYELETDSVASEDLLTRVAELRAEGFGIIALSARAAELIAAADSASDLLFLNIAATDTRLRSADCRANMLHITPSAAMRADAVAQFSAVKQWKRWFLVYGSNPSDITLADEYRRAAQKFGLSITDEREILDTGGARRADTGHVAVQRQIPVLVQNPKDHDVVIAADASDVFAPYLPFHLWTPRPTMGAAGLRPVSFNPATESWGGMQFQSRFDKLAGRYVTEADYDAWLALRAIGEAVVRTGVNDPAELRSFMLSEEFELAAFKGQPVTFRNWNGQMRQPVLLYDGRINASVSPQEGFLHQFSPLDTLGLDRPESVCDLFERDQR
ncbi:branched-chain amino acid ABC transporter substrate-binding protein [Sulfitobacter sp. EhC04]|uniref:ABC transporter substrate-binding protein n=1 Tax=Sulfitobacter sp. EhC04 TaxID=1849168 RepID=UPI0007F3ABC2|nr:ABC transporter substrate-binding protein [Sulfitobacter sp. EhC04]OAN75155.1 branched-chain amino acid ABC transporter substrate-binding protein [Sulfitobacter sp. EhC04]